MNTTQEMARNLPRIGARVSPLFSITAGLYPLTGMARDVLPERGYRVIAHDRRGHGRSTQTLNGNGMDTYAADVAELVTALDLKDVIHIGHPRAAAK
jgi:pimeloyl-ACP methyl ester carboxylesterase